MRIPGGDRGDEIGKPGGHDGGLSRRHRFRHLRERLAQGDIDGFSPRSGYSLTPGDRGAAIGYGGGAGRAHLTDAHLQGAGSGETPPLPDDPAFRFDLLESLPTRFRTWLSVRAS